MDKTRFREVLIARMAAAGITSAELHRRTGVSKDTIDKLRQRTIEQTTVDNGVRIANFFGQSVDEFVGAAPAGDVPAIAALISRLSDHDQEIVRAQIEALLALRSRR